MTERKRTSRYPAPVSTLLTEAFRGKPLGKVFSEVEIWRAWDQVVGRQIAAKARPSRFIDGLLTVVVVSSPWMQQLNFMKRDIAGRLNEKLGKNLVKEIYLKTGKPSLSSQPKKTAGPVRRTLTDTERSSIEATVQSISNAELRKAFADLLTEHLSSTGDKD